MRQLKLRKHAVSRAAIMLDGGSIIKNGLDVTRGTTFVSRDIAAAENALLNHPDFREGREYYRVAHSYKPVRVDPGSTGTAV